MDERPAIHLTRLVQLPDEVRVERIRHVPELGPRILFFSGGTALKDLSREIIRYTHNSIHLITPFDSGGSSAVIREEFKMLAVGDIRNRLMALADQTIRGNPDIYRLFAYRFPKSQDQGTLEKRLRDMIDGKDPLIAAVEDPLRKIIRNHLGYFAEAMSDEFDLRGASIGNLILTGGFLNNSRHIDPVIFLFTKLVETRGTVRPIVNADLHLGAELRDGSIVLGQHRLSGKDAPPVSSPVKNLFINRSLHDHDPVDLEIREKTRQLIASADLICFPVGSFYSSLIANLLPKGVGKAVAKNPAPKIYIPNCGTDPEQAGLNVDESVDVLLHYLRQSAGRDVQTGDLLNFVILDTRRGEYAKLLNRENIRAKGIEIIDVDLISAREATQLDPEKLAKVLLSLC